MPESSLSTGVGAGALRREPWEAGVTEVRTALGPDGGQHAFISAPKWRVPSAWVGVRLLNMVFLCSMSRSNTRRCRHSAYTR